MGDLNVGPPVDGPEPMYKDYKTARQEEYQAISDPLYFKWQRGEATEQEWLDAVAEIKTQHPKPV